MAGGKSSWRKDSGGMSAGIREIYAPTGPSVPFMHLADEVVCMLIDPPNGKIRLPFAFPEYEWRRRRPSMSCERCADEQTRKMQWCRTCDRRVCSMCRETSLHNRPGTCLDCA